MTEIHSSQQQRREKCLSEIRDFTAPNFLLLGPGPSNAHPRVLTVMANQQVGHLSKPFVQVMDDIREMLRYVFQTENENTFAISGTGSGSMEAALVNVIEPGDVVLIGVCGYWGPRQEEVIKGAGGEVVKIESKLGAPLSLAEIEEGLQKHQPKVLVLTHGESSTGVLQPLEGVGALCRKHNCLLVVDTVVPLAGAPLFVDKWEIDVCYSGSQKCLSCPPGASPITFGPRAVAKHQSRKSPVVSAFFDLKNLQFYWLSKKYHHTAPINLFYALREALRVILEEGLENSWARSRRAAEKLWSNLESMGLEMFVANPQDRVPVLTTVKIPQSLISNGQGVNVPALLLSQFKIEIAGGLGPTAGLVWRIGLMGYNATEQNVNLLSVALHKILCEDLKFSAKL